jgi:hypothetical protein
VPDDGPPGATFAVLKEWFDPAPDVGLVEIHYAWTPAGRDADWETGAEATVLQAADGGRRRPARRTAILEIPREVAGATTYTLHHFFFVVTTGGRSTTPVFQEEVGAREVRYEDADGRYTHVGVQWAVGGPSAVNEATLTLDGLAFSGATTAERGSSETMAPVFDFVRAVPLPHVFRGRVWGLRGQPVDYAFRCVRLGSPNAAEDGETWDDNGGARWRLEI